MTVDFAPVRTTPSDTTPPVLSLILGREDGSVVGLEGGSREGGTIEGRITIALAGTHWIAGGNLRIPVRVAIDVDNTHDVVAVEESTGIFGVGVTLADAVTDLRSALLEHLDVLANADQLSAGLADQLHLLRRMIKDS